jgi:hypothetical protein
MYSEKVSSSCSTSGRGRVTLVMVRRMWYMLEVYILYLILHRFEILHHNINLQSVSIGSINASRQFYSIELYNQI